MLNHVLLQPSIGEPIKWYEPADNAREVLDQFPDMAFSHLEWESWDLAKAVGFDGEQSEFETCDVTGLRGNCVAVSVIILV